MGKKFIFYLENVSRPIMITCNKENRSWDELKKAVSEAITSDNVAFFNTDNDCLLLKPNKISGVYIEEIKDSKKSKDDSEEYDIFSEDVLDPDFDIGGVVSSSVEDIKKTKEVVANKILDEFDKPNKKFSLDDAFDDPSDSAMSLDEDDSGDDDFLSRLNDTIKTKTFDDDVESELTEEELSKPFDENDLEDEIEKELAELSYYASEIKENPKAQPIPTPKKEVTVKETGFHPQNSQDVVEVIEVDANGNPINQTERPKLVGSDTNAESRINAVIENVKKKGSKNIMSIKPIIRGK